MIMLAAPLPSMRCDIPFRGGSRRKTQYELSVVDKCAGDKAVAPLVPQDRVPVV